MAGSTPIYGFPYPESSDLVANYPALGQDLAEDIEGVIAGLGAGLDHINTTTFTTQSTVSINNVFTSGYGNYRILLEAVGTASCDMHFRMRVSGTDNSGASSYVGQRLGINGTSVGAGRDTQSFFYVSGLTNGGRGTFAIDIFNPALALNTMITNHAMLNVSNAYILMISGTHVEATAYDGFTVFLTSGTMTGTVRVYGYKNS